ncbi:MAG: hypothetical protein ABW061_13195, partial [Polyangiaceae bacterium]
LQSGATNGDGFGSAVAIDGDTVLVGAPSASVGTGADVVNGAGIAYFSVRSGSTWSLAQALPEPDVSANAAFGAAVAVSGNIAVVGGWAGSAYVFERQGAVWSEVLPPLQGDPDTSAADLFGSAVAVHGDQMIVGAPYNSPSGAAYLFKRQSGTGEWLAASPTLHLPLGLPGDGFGFVVALGERYAVVSAIPSGNDASTVFVFDTTDLDAPPVQLTNDDTLPSDLFGSSLAVYDHLGGAGDTPETVVVGSPAASAPSVTLPTTNVQVAGAAYIFEAETPSAPSGSAAVWGKPKPVFSEVPTDNQKFGTAVAISKSVLVAVAPNTEQGSFSLAFVRQKGAWSSPSQLVAHSAQRIDLSDQAAAVSGTTVVVGSPSIDGQQGSVAVFALSDGQPCTSGSDCTSSHCSEGICCDEDCANKCNSCLATQNTAKVDGKCSPVPVSKDFRDGCEATSAAGCQTTGSCDGKGACALFPAQTECAPATCDSQTAKTSACDGTGKCKETVKSCNKYQCSSSENSCRSKCENNEDCDSKAFCNSGHLCETKHAIQCTDDSSGVLGSDGQIAESCAPFLCFEGKCRTTCSPSGECAAGFVCDDGDQCSAPPDPGSKTPNEQPVAGGAAAGDGACSTSNECAAGLACIDNQCQKVETRSDSGSSGCSLLPGKRRNTTNQTAATCLMLLAWTLHRRAARQRARAQYSP